MQFFYDDPFMEIFMRRDSFLESGVLLIFENFKNVPTPGLHFIYERSFSSAATNFTPALITPEN